MEERFEEFSPYVPHVERPMERAKELPHKVSLEWVNLSAVTVKKIEADTMQYGNIYAQKYTPREALLLRECSEQEFSVVGKLFENLFKRSLLSKAIKRVSDSGYLLPPISFKYDWNFQILDKELAAVNLPIPILKKGKPEERNHISIITSHGSNLYPYMPIIFCSHRELSPKTYSPIVSELVEDANRILKSKNFTDLFIPQYNSIERRPII